MDALNTTTPTQQRTGPAYWRERLNTLLPEFRCAQRMQDMQNIRRCELNWVVIYYGRRHIEQRLAGCIECMGGLLGEW